MQTFALSYMYVKTPFFYVSSFLWLHQSVLRSVTSLSVSLLWSQKPTVLRFWCFLWDRRWTAVNTEGRSTASSPVSLRWTSAAVSSRSTLASHAFTWLQILLHSAVCRISRSCMFRLQVLRIPTPWPVACHCLARLEEDSGATEGLRVQASSHTHLCGIAFTRRGGDCWLLNGYHKKPRVLY